MSAHRAVSGVSFSAPQAFFRGLNSSSLGTSKTANFLKRRQQHPLKDHTHWLLTTTTHLANWKMSKTNFSNLMPFGVLGDMCSPLLLIKGIFFLATWCTSSSSCVLYRKDNFGNSSCSESLSTPCGHWKPTYRLSWGIPRWGNGCRCCLPWKWVFHQDLSSLQSRY